MYKKILLLIVIALSLFSCQKNLYKKGKVSVFIDTDCGTDDLIAVELLLNNSKSFDITGISCVHGLTKVKDGAKVMRGLLDKYKRGDIPVFCGAAKPLFKTHPFPKLWIDQSTKLGLIQCNNSNEGKEFDSKQIIDIINRSNSKILALGPLTNIKHLLNKGLDTNTETICMGGAISVEGNITGNGEFETDNIYSEWNFYADPLAAKYILDSLTNLLLVPLDATNDVIIDSRYLDFNNWKDKDSTVSFSIIKSVENWIREGQYYAWDPLASATIINRDIVVIDSAHITISLEKGEMGRVIKSENGNITKYCKSASKNLFDKLILKDTISLTQEKKN